VEAALPTVFGAAGAIGGGALGTLTGPAAPYAVPALAVGGGYAGSQAGNNWNNFIGTQLEGTSLKNAWDSIKEQEPSIHENSKFVGELGGAVLTGGARAPLIVRKLTPGLTALGPKAVNRYSNSLESLLTKQLSRAGQPFPFSDYYPDRLTKALRVGTTALSEYGEGYVEDAVAAPEFPLARPGEGDRSRESILAPLLYRKK
jgi:hypothetical protein